MADASLSTRRSVPTTHAALSALAMPDAPDRHSRFWIEGRMVTVDTADLPEVSMGEESDGLSRPISLVRSVSEPGAEYVVVTADGTMAVRVLCEGELMKAMPPPRLGFVPSREGGAYVVSHAVTVIGKVVGMNTHISMTGAEPLTMSSREIAELTGKRHDHVLRDIKTMMDGLELDAPKFGAIYLDAMNREKTEYRLPKDLTITLVAGYDVVLRKRIVDRWMELEARPQTFDPAAFFESPAAMRGLLLTYADRLITLEEDVVKMSGDVAAHERLTKAEGSLSVTEAAKNLGVRPKELFDWLKNNGWTYKRPGSANWLGYQPKCNQGLLEHKTTTVLRADGSEKITEQVRITAKGLSALAKLIKPSA